MEAVVQLKGSGEHDGCERRVQSLYLPPDDRGRVAHDYCTWIAATSSPFGSLTVAGDLNVQIEDPRNE